MTFFSDSVSYFDGIHRQGGQQLQQLITLNLHLESEIMWRDIEKLHSKCDQMIKLQGEKNPVCILWMWKEWSDINQSEVPDK